MVELVGEREESSFGLVGSAVPGSCHIGDTRLILLPGKFPHGFQPSASTTLMMKLATETHESFPSLDNRGLLYHYSSTK